MIAISASIAPQPSAARAPARRGPDGLRQAAAAGRWLALAMAVAALLAAAGCGTTRSSDSMRTATEQMLMSMAIDKAVNEINFAPLAGREVYLDTDRLRGFVDENYLTSTLRQAMFASGVILKPDRASAKYIVEARAGVLGTNSNSVLIGVPAVNLPNVTGVPGVPTAIPEIPFAKTSRQAGIAKVALFAYNQQTGKPIWQSGAIPATSDAKNTWFFGAGPFQRGSIYGGGRTRFAGNDKGLVPFKDEGKLADTSRPSIPVTTEAVFDEPEAEVARLPADRAKTDSPASAAAANTPATTAPPPAAAAPAKPATPPPAPPPVVPPAPVTSVPLDQSSPLPAAGIINAGNWLLNDRPAGRKQ